MSTQMVPRGDAVEHEQPVDSVHCVGDRPEVIIWEHQSRRRFDVRGEDYVGPVVGNCGDDLFYRRGNEG